MRGFDMPDEPQPGLQIPVTVERFVRDTARVEGLQVAREHVAECPVRSEHAAILLRIQALEMRLATLIAFMLGSGLLGGAMGAGIVKLLMAP